MTRSERAGRFGLALVYAALTVWTQAGDLHGHAKAAEVHCDPACREAREHYAGHPAPTVDPRGNDCLACQGRTVVADLEPPSPSPADRAAEPVASADSITQPSRPLGAPSSRGPPSA